MPLTPRQKKQIELQIKAHEHKKYYTDIALAEGYLLKNFAVYPKVMRPEIMTSLFLAKWLFFNNGFYKNKNFLDMGCGSGILGVVAGLYGANKVVFSDIDLQAFKNTEENVRNFCLKNNSRVLCGNLFERVKGKFDVIVFNHPFFGDVSKKYKNTAMINDGQILHEFLKEAKKFLNERGIIIMPYYHLAGIANNPEIQSKKYGYKTTERLFLNSRNGLQRGPISIYELHLKLLLPSNGEF